MKSIEHIKWKLYMMENDRDWMTVCRYLMLEWKQQKDSPALCTLLLQQSMACLLASNDDVSPYSCPLNHHNEENPSFYQNCFMEAANYGINHHLNDKYFLWQMCYYLFHFPTYYPVLMVIGNDKVETLQNKLVSHAKTQFAESDLFSPWLIGIDYYEWLNKLSSDELTRVHSEIEEFQLGKNAVDEDVKRLFFLRY